MDTETNIQHRDAFVIFVPDHGFFKNRRRDYTSNFSDARIFGAESAAENCVDEINITGKPCIIPVTMTLDPRHLFTAVLKG